MADNPPYMNGYGYITKALKKIGEASTPPRFTHDFLATKLGLKGGSARPLIPFLKRTGFIGSDGVPTDLYKRFRNPTERGKAAAEALRHGYSGLYEVNEYLHDISDKDLKGVVVQATGAEPDSSTVKGIIGSFKALREFADFEATDFASTAIDSQADPTPPRVQHSQGPTLGAGRGLGLSYTINLNLPATSDIAVFDAIFKSLKEHLLR